MRLEQQVLRLDVAMDQVILAQVLEGTGDLLEKVACQHFVQTTVGRVVVFVNDFPRPGQSGDAGSTLHECSQIRHLTVLHDQTDVLRSVEASWLWEVGDRFLRLLVREPDRVGWRCKN
jgi:hypothetical protein